MEELKTLYYIPNGNGYDVIRERLQNNYSLAFDRKNALSIIIEWDDERKVTKEEYVKSKKLAFNEIVSNVKDTLKVNKIVKEERKEILEDINCIFKEYLEI